MYILLYECNLALDPSISFPFQDATDLGFNRSEEYLAAGFNKTNIWCRFHMPQDQRDQSIAE